MTETTTRFSTEILDRAGLTTDDKDFAALTRAKDRRRLALMQLERLEERDRDLRAFVRCDIGRAREVIERSEGAAPLGPALLGVKDVIDVAGLPTAGGRQEPGPVAVHDAWCVAAARGAGLVPVGKTAMSAFAAPVPGPTVNPHDATRTPGGSSSGSAAAVAVGLVPFAFGSQTAGSTIRPASYCGVTGFKPTFGLLATHGMATIAPTLDHVGLFARSPRDVWMLVDAMLGGRGERLEPVPPHRLLLWRMPPEVPLTDGYRDRLDHLADDLRRVGVDVVAEPLPMPVEDLDGLQRLICHWEAARVHADGHDPALGAEARAALAPYAAMDATPYLAARTRLAGHAATLSRALADVDAVLLPAATGAAPDRSGTGDALMSRLWTALHAPAITVPVWRTGGGLPLGLQLVGRIGADRRLCALAQWFLARWNP